METNFKPGIGRRSFCGLAATATVLLGWPPLAKAAPVADLWERWLLHEPESRYRIDHSTWDTLLQRYLLAGPDRINRFDYGAVTAEDRTGLDSYLAMLGEILISQYNRGEQFAFWLNLYNALVVQVVLDHYPVRSIREIDIGPSLFGDGPWSARLTAVEEEPLSLDDIEHRILRPIWEDPRVHYVINCAALGCPQLPRRAMTAANREAMLEEAARAFVNHPRGVRMTSGSLPRGLVLSRIYDWYVSDFGGYEDAVLAHIRRYAEPKLATLIDALPYIAGYQYEWALNDVQLAPSG